MDDALQQAEDAQPGDDPNIQKAREELKDVDEGMDKVFNSTKELEEAHKSGDPSQIEEKFLAANKAQADFADQYQEMSEAMEKAGFKIPRWSNDAAVLKDEWVAWGSAARCADSGPPARPPRPL
jgi:hypothetical protein